MAQSTGHATVTKDPDRHSDLIRRHGVINPDIPTGNAEDLIRAHHAAQSRAVQKASLLPLDTEATAELDLDEIQSELGGDDEVLAAAVRGNAIVAVVADQNGRTYKTVLPANDRYVPPEEDVVEVETTKAQADFQAEIAKLRAEHEAELAEVRAEHDEKLAKEIAKLREEILGGLGDRIESAQKEQKKRQEAAKGGGAESVQQSDAKQGTGPKQAKGDKADKG